MVLVDSGSVRLGQAALGPPWPARGGPRRTPLGRLAVEVLPRPRSAADDGPRGVNPEGKGEQTVKIQLKGPRARKVTKMV